MRTAGTAVLLAAALGGLTGCVQPTTGASASIPLSDWPPFPVSFLPPDRAPRPTLVGGALGPVTTGRDAVVIGWVPRHNARLIVVSEQRVALRNQRRLVRHDAARVLAPGSGYDLGFRLVLQPATGELRRLCVLAVLPGVGVAWLAGSDPTLCPPPA